MGTGHGENEEGLHRTSTIGMETGGHHVHVTCRWRQNKFIGEHRHLDWLWGVVEKQRSNLSFKSRCQMRFVLQILLLSPMLEEIKVVIFLAFIMWSSIVEFTS